MIFTKNKIIYRILAGVVATDVWWPGYMFYYGLRPTMPYYALYVLPNVHQSMSCLDYSILPHTCVR